MDLKDCPFSTRAVVELSGDVELDKEIWLKKLNNEILGIDANPLRWAKQLSQYLNYLNHSNIWKRLLDKKSFVRICPRHTDSLISRYCTNCNFSTCNKCKFDSHRDHKVDCLSDVLENLSRKCQEQEIKLKKLVEILNKAMKAGRKRVLVEQNRLDMQYQNIQRQLASFQKSQLEKINAYGKKHLAQHYEQIDKLEQCVLENKNLQNEVEKST